MYDTFVLFREGDAVGIYRSEHVSKWIPQNSPNFFISRNKMTYYHLLLPPKKLSKRWSEGMDFPWQSFLLVRWLWLGWSSEPWRSTIHCGVWRHACASDESRVDGLMPSICWEGRWVVWHHNIMTFQKLSCISTVPKWMILLHINHKE